MTHTPIATGTLDWEPRDGDAPQARRMLAGPGLTLVRISFRRDQILDDHRAPGPILVSCVHGAITLDVHTADGAETHELAPGTTVYIAGGDVHRLVAREDAVVQVTLQRDITG
ncbi:hypothetical protein NONO_c06280 [Nocardia nova SH22a]|uniref:Cupin domain-containing protein n=1 Tax=Nocardia nova SH22a TaxID=1415166 RepID=W5T802_9NOCA|nr:hypothetical protein [Nocardia nova]AHH15440.1 hypothetical protein NONO_c06280 [Nocardia nova SH22a]